jgi:hypothetical protein
MVSPFGSLALISVMPQILGLDVHGHVVGKIHD